MRWLNPRHLTLGGAAVSLAIAGAWAAAESSTGLRAIYFTDDHWEHAAYALVDHQINTDTLTADAPVSPDQPFSVRWFGWFDARQRGTYAFALDAQGTAGMAIDQPTAASSHVFSVITDVVQLDEGSHPISISYSHADGRYGIDLWMSVNGGPSRSVRASELAPHRRTSFMFRTIAALERVVPVLTLAWAVFGYVWLVRRTSRPLVIALTIVTTILIVALTVDTPVWLRGPAPYPGGWQWEYHLAGSWRRAGAALIGLAGVIAAVAFLSAGRSNRSRARGRIGLAGAMIGGLVFYLGVLHLGQGGAAASIGRLTRSDTSTGYFDVALKRLSTTHLIANYSAMLIDFPVHARTHPPGPILYYRAFVNVFRAAPSFAGSVIQKLEAAHVPVERFARNGRGDRDPDLAAAALLSGFGTLLAAILIGWCVARIAEAGGADSVNAARAGALWMLCPAAFFFLPNFDAISGLLVALTAMLACTAFTAERQDRAALCGFGSGLTAGGALFGSFAMAPMLAAAGLTALVATIRPPFSWRRVRLVGTAAVIGLAAILSVPLVLGFDYVGTARGIMYLHWYHYNPPGRALWMRFNLLDFSIFLGWPLIVWVAMLTFRNRWWAARLVLTTAAIVLMMDLADLVHSEVGRLWMPLMPPIFAAAGVAASTDRTQDADWIAVAVSLAITSLTIALHWSP
jgi:hypothetical protein